MTEPIEYEIIGIYLGLTQQMRDHAISPNTVIVPAASVGGIDGLPAIRRVNSFDPPLLKTLIIPNDALSETKAMLESIDGGYANLFRFYDQGYSTLKPILSNLRIGMTWITVLSAVGWIIALAMFMLFYVGRKNREVSLLYALGVTRKHRLHWVVIQCMIIILFAQFVLLCGTLPIHEKILDTAITASRAFTESYRDLTLSELNESGGYHILMPLDRTAIGLIVVTAAQAVVLLLTAFYVARKAAKKRWTMQVQE